MSEFVLKYFAGGNTAKGFYSLYDENLVGIEHVFILSGKSQREKTDLITRLIQKWKHIPLEVIYRANDPDSPEGLVIRSLGFAILDGDGAREIGEKFIGSQWETIDLDPSSRMAALEGNAKNIQQLKQGIEIEYDQAYQAYANALSIHDDWENIYIKHMDFVKANEVTSDLITTLFSKAKESGQSTILRRFLGAATPKGPVDYVNNITEGLKARYFLKGRAGTGKSTLLKKVVSEAEKHGYDMEIYHCGFDPNSLDMVLVRELDWAVFDSTAPHEYNPERPGDEVIDMYELTVAPGIDETFANEIADIEARYREQMNIAKKHLMEAKRLTDEVEIIYSEATDREHIDTVFQEIDQLISHLAANE